MASAPRDWDAGDLERVMELVIRALQLAGDPYYIPKEGRHLKVFLQQACIQSRRRAGFERESPCDEQGWHLIFMEAMRYFLALPDGFYFVEDEEPQPSPGEGQSKIGRVRELLEDTVFTETLTV